MKLKFLLLFALFIATYQFSAGQTKYFKQSNGGILDSVTYYQKKAAQIERMQQLYKSEDKKVTISDNFKELKRTKDSLIYNYKWVVNIRENKTENENIFNPQDYLGKEFPLPLLKTLNNKAINLNELKGKPTLINFWFTTCKPCIDEMPILNRIASKFKDSANFIAITFEKPDKVKPFLSKNKFNFTQIADAKVFTDSMKMQSFPINIFLDKNGIVVRIDGGIPYLLNEKKELEMSDGKEFIAILKELL